jgi:hypothetical protein
MARPVPEFQREPSGEGGLDLPGERFRNVTTT